MNKTELHEYVSEKCANICGIAAAKDGNIFYEDLWNGFGGADALHVMSVTKSVVSLLVGIAMDIGLIESVCQPVLEFFPDYHIKRGEKTIQNVTIEHLLTMTAPWKYKSEPWTRVCTSDDWTVAALDLLGGRSGITNEFRYSTLGIHILTGIIAKTSGLSTVDFANGYLFVPLGIAPHENFEALDAEEHKTFIMSKKPKRNVWFVDPRGVGAAGYGLCLTVMDMLKIGQLCLDGGECGGKRIVSGEWITESTKVRRICGDDFANMGYGYLWWTPDPSTSAYAALGNSGNVIYVDPERNIAVAVYGTFKPTVLDRVDFIKEYIIPMADATKEERNV